MKHDDERMMQLMRYADGEMPEAERAAFALSLGEEDRARLEAIAEIGQAVRQGVEVEGAGVDLWAGIAAEVGPKRKRSRTRMVSVVVAFAAAAAAFMVLMRPVARMQPTDGCDVEQLETDGALASVIAIDDDRDEPGATVIWIDELEDEEEEEEL